MSHDDPNPTLEGLTQRVAALEQRLTSVSDQVRQLARRLGELDRLRKTVAGLKSEVEERTEL